MDPVRIHLVMLNLLGNAFKYTDSGYISLDVDGIVNGDMLDLTFKVSDSGRGIKEEDLSALFDEFKQFDTMANRGIEGTGLGLSITRSLVYLMGGKIEAESTYGVGSTFIVNLSQPVRDWSRLASVDSPRDKPTIVFERRYSFILSISMTLGDLGLPYKIAKTHEEFFDALSSNEYTYAFLADNLYDAFIKQYPLFSFNTRIILIGGFGNDDITKTKEFPVLTSPIYCIPVAAILNKSKRASDMAAIGLPAFRAPDAKVLLVDDILTNLMVAEGLLKPYGMSIDSVESGKEAILAVQTHDYDLVFMDHMMPEMDGITATQTIRALEGEKYSRLPILALTANAIIGASDMFLENGFNDFLSKPIEVAKLDKILSRWILREKQQYHIPYPGHEGQKTNPSAVIIEIEGMDTAKGIAFSGGDIQDYFEILEVFVNNSFTKISQLEKCLEENDISLYTIYIHALKSASANVGADKLSQEAEKLETAGTAHDTKFIIQNHNNFVKNLKTMLENIGSVIGMNAETPQSIAIDKAIMISKLAELKAALENFDVDAIDKVSKVLRDFNHHPDVGDAIKEMLHNAFVGKYKQATAQADELMAR